MSFSVFHGPPTSNDGQAVPSGVASFGIDVTAGQLYYRNPQSKAQAGWQAVVGSNAVVLNPAVDQTITGSHALNIPAGFLFVGPSDPEFPDPYTSAIAATTIYNGTGINSIGSQSFLKTVSGGFAALNQIIVQSSVAGAVSSTGIACFADVIVEPNNAATVVDQVNGFYADADVNGPGTLTEGNCIYVNGFGCFGGGHLTNAYGIHIQEMTEGTAGHTNVYAIGIEDQGANYAILARGTTAKSQLPNLVLAGVAPVAAATQVSLGATHQATVGGAGGASAQPATPLGYLLANVEGTVVAIPYHKAS